MQGDREFVRKEEENGARCALRQLFFRNTFRAAEEEYTKKILLWCKSA
jgi:hypothetical protein